VVFSNQSGFENLTGLKAKKSITKQDKEKKLDRGWNGK